MQYCCCREGEGGGGWGRFRLKTHIEVRFKWMWFPRAIFKVQSSHSGRPQRRSLIPPRQEVYYSSHPSASTARFDFIVTMFVVGEIDEDTVNCPRFVAFKGAVSREHSSSSFNLGQLTKRIHVDSDELDEEEKQQAQRTDQRRRALSCLIWNPRRIWPPLVKLGNAFCLNWPPLSN